MNTYVLCSDAGYVHREPYGFPYQVCPCYMLKEKKYKDLGDTSFS